ncbi:hypothetical protein CCO03_08475 [Comamonas serinivorans]|uniref:Uncharacterized protein n=1 Tax=Comamonas serinivorans TaxID=1082851 RepID=A0A1Y0EM13_9BURK|nr:hypothetical protein [Comamonas serinivorans]ARU04704.1 hypothetical protein CCO03_08475 [Comamonas serinivorans]
MKEPIEITLRDQLERGWWVDQSQWFEQKVWPLTGVWQPVRLKNGDITRGVMLAGYNGWRNGNYAPINVVQWLKPARWFASPEDMEGKVKEYAEYRHAVLYERKSPLRAQEQQKGLAP